jgi:dienelactone hydrolase
MKDMDVDPSKGIGRALFAALDQLANSSGHTELASAKLILMSFSGGGSLVARLTGYAPDRVIAAIPADPSQFDPLGMDTVTVSPNAQEIPQLILAGSTDHVSGTKRPYEYFRKYFDKGAPWAFVIQNKIPHCCIINAKKLILLWVQAILEERQSSNGVLRSLDTTRGGARLSPLARARQKMIGVLKTWEVSDAKIRHSRSGPPEGMTSAGWLPSHRVGKEWLSFVRQPRHPVTSLP